VPVGAAVVGVLPVTVGGGMPGVRHPNWPHLASGGADAVGKEGCATNTTQVLPNVLSKGR
jgi:hypothetical protein